MKKKHVYLLIILIGILIGNKGLAQGEKTILILTDKLTLADIDRLSLTNPALGLINLKTRPPQNEENLYLSINTGRKLGTRDRKSSNDKLVFLGDVLSTSLIGGSSEKKLIGNKQGQVNFHQPSIKYNLSWLVDESKDLLEKSDLLLVNYEFEEEYNRYELLRNYTKEFRDKKIIILPKKLVKDRGIEANPYLVPIIYLRDGKAGVLTSESTRRSGLLALEDMASEIKGAYQAASKIDIGRSFQIIESKNPLGAIKRTYKETINLLIIAYFFHGLIYLSQVYLAIYIQIKGLVNRKLFYLYVYLGSIILTSLMLGIFNLHQNISLYILLNMLLAYLIIRFMIRKKINMVKALSYLSYSLILLGISFWPKLIYDSFIGFNNLIYGARFYGLNNGIMGVMLANFILSFYFIEKSLIGKKRRLILLISLSLINLFILSTKLGANTGGLLVSLGLFVAMVHYYFPEFNKIKTIILILSLIALLSYNIYLNASHVKATHGIQLIFRIREKGVSELSSIVYYKLMELIRLFLTPIFSVVILMQIIIIYKLKSLIKVWEDLSREVVIIIISSLLSLLLNDTGVIPFIYINNYLILFILGQEFGPG